MTPAGYNYNNGDRKSTMVSGATPTAA